MKLTAARHVLSLHMVGPWLLAQELYSSTTGLLVVSGMQSIAVAMLRLDRRMSSSVTNKSKLQGRLPPYDDAMYGITRVEHDRHGQSAWLVHLSRGGRRIQTTFSDSTYGGSEPTLMVARAYRDAVLKAVPPLTKRDVRMLVRTTRPSYSNIPGVYYKSAGQRRPAYWIAQIEVEHPGPKQPGKRNRKTIRRFFNVSQYGNDRAKELAEEERIRMVLAVENGENHR